MAAANLIHDCPITLISSDGIAISTSYEVLKLTDLRRQLNCGQAGLVNEAQIPTDVAAEELQLIIKWAEHHKMESPLFITQWDMEFLHTVDARDLMKLLCAADRIRISPLLRIGMRVMNEKTRWMSIQEKMIIYGLSYKLKSSDGAILYLSEVAEKLAPHFCSQGFKLDTEEPIPMETNSTILSLIIEWCEHHRQDSNLSQWDQKFVEAMKWADLQEVCVHAHKLGIQGLYDVTMKVIVNLYQHGRLDGNLEIKMEVD